MSAGYPAPGIVQPSSGIEDLTTTPVGVHAAGVGYHDGIDMMAMTSAVGRRGCGRRRVVVAAATAGILLAPGVAGANAAVFYLDAGAGGALLPRSTQDVGLVSEYLQFIEATQEVEPGPDQSYARLQWHVRAEYVLENLTTERVELDVGFPVVGGRGRWEAPDPIEGGPDSWEGGAGTQSLAASFHVRLDDAALRHRLVHNDCPAGERGATAGAAGRCYPDVFLFHTAIDAGKQATLIVEYDQSPTLCCNNEGQAENLYAWVDYILETGALWAGTVGRLDVVYDFAVPPPEGAMIYDRLVGAELPAQSLYWQETDTERMQGWVAGIESTRAPDDVVTLWDPEVRFHTAFACRNGRVVLRLKATEFEPGGNISLGVQNVGVRLAALAEGVVKEEEETTEEGYTESVQTLFAPCAVSRSVPSDPGGTPSPWKRTVWTDTSTVEDYHFYRSDDEQIAAPPPEWGCSILDFLGGPWEYRFDCCCATMAGFGGWNPDCDKPGQAGGPGCSAAPTSGPHAPATPAAVAGSDATGEVSDAAAQDAEAADAETETDAAAQGASDAEGRAEPAAGAGPTPAPAVIAATADGAAAETPARAAPPAGEGAPTAPPASGKKSGCHCAAAGAGGSSPWPGLALLGVLLFARRRSHGA